MARNKSGIFPVRNIINSLYFIKDGKKGAYCVVLGISSFLPDNVIMNNLTREEVKDFLYNTDKLGAKCIFDKNAKIKYARFLNDTEPKINNYLDLSDESIIKLYNNIHERYKGFTKINSIEDVKEVSIVYKSPYELAFSETSPVLILAKNDEIYVYKFGIVYSFENDFTINASVRRLYISKEILSKIEHNLPKEYSEPCLIDLVL